MDTRSALIALNMIQGLGSVRVNRLLGRYADPAEIFEAPQNELMQVEGLGGMIAERITRFDPALLERELDDAASKKVKIVTVMDDDYPALLKRIYDPPPVLYAAGCFDSMPGDALRVGIVGTRQATDYGERALKLLIEQMRDTHLPFMVVSGMARGIDTIAHMESLNLGFYNIAVLGFGFNHIWPFTGHYIAQHLIKNGALLSEFPLNTIPLKQNFPQRNRVISGLSDAVIIVEAAKRSGALITADCALEQGREVFAVPGPIYAEQSIGTNNLIKMGAKPVCSIYDLIEEFEFVGEAKRPEPGAAPMMELTDDEKKVYAFLSSEKKHIDNIAIESNMDVIKLSCVLTVLELKGAVKQLGGKCFVRA